MDTSVSACLRWSWRAVTNRVQVGQHVPKSPHNGDLPSPLRASPTTERKEDTRVLKRWLVRRLPTFSNSYVGPTR